MYSRREFVISATATVISVIAGLAAGAPREQKKTRLILLGTGGGPRPRSNSFPSSQVIVVNGSAYVVDCGDGVATQLVRAGIPLTTVRHVFITHHHSDHNADYGNLLLLAWESGLQKRVDTWGPPPLRRITRLFLNMNAVDIEARVQDEGRSPIEPLVHAHELTSSGEVVADANVIVRCAVVHHPPLRLSFAYRFDSADRSIVVSGDTTPSNALIRLAKGADVLVHEALYAAALDALAARMPNGEKLKKSILSHHTSVEDAGRVASAAGVRTLVLSHFVPPDDAAITPDMWAAAARKHYNGQIIVGRDLLEI